MAMRVTKPPKEKSGKPKYENGKSYEWKKDDEFILTGSEFSLLYNVMKLKYDESLANVEAFKVLHKLLESGINEGTVVEMKQNNEVKDSVPEPLPEPLIIT